jgi:Fur family zinc uptake transcriptional regulator
MNRERTKPCIAFERHDHRDCQHHQLSVARELCAKRNIRLTARRLQVLEILLQSHQPMGAYEILAHLNQAQNKQTIAPPIVYRALDFLLAEGLVHRIESKKAFISCTKPGHQCTAQFLICRDCEKVAELENPDSALLSEAANVGFAVDHSVVEFSGICADCRENAV